MAADPEPLFPEDGDRALTAFRWSTYDVPFWARQNSNDGRWNYGLQDSTQYWSLTPEASWAELIRHEGLKTEEELDLVRMPFWIARIPSSGLLDLRFADERDAYEINHDDLISDDWGACQALAVVLREAGTRGVIAPSAALPESASITVFGPRRAIDWTSRPTLASTIPAARAALGRPPAGLLPRVHHRRRPGPLGERLF